MIFNKNSVTAAEKGRLVRTPAFKLSDLEHSVDRHGEYYTLDLHEKVRKNTIYIGRWKKCPAGKRRGAYGAIELYKGKFGVETESIMTFQRRKNHTTELENSLYDSQCREADDALSLTFLTRNRYYNDLQIAARIVNGRRGTSFKMGAKIIRKMAITLLADTQSLLRVSHYTRNSIRTIQRYYYTPDIEELATGREDAAALLSQGDNLS